MWQTRVWQDKNYLAIIFSSWTIQKRLENNSGHICSHGKTGAKRKRAISNWEDISSMSSQSSEVSSFLLQKSLKQELLANVSSAKHSSVKAAVLTHTELLRPLASNSSSLGLFNIPWPQVLPFFFIRCIGATIIIFNFKTLFRFLTVSDIILVN